MVELLEGIGHNIRRLRGERGWNQAELGFHADTSPSIISLIENGKRNPSTATLAKIAGALGVEVVELFPKASGRSSAQPTLLNGVEDERPAVIFAEAMIALADRWIGRVSDPGLDEDKVIGLVDAALDLSEVVYERAGDLWKALPDQDEDMIITIMKKTSEVIKLGGNRLKDKNNAAEFQSRREQMRQRTREISRRSAKTA